MDANQAVRSHERLVRWAAHAVQDSRLSKDEKIQAARIGLWKAILRYDPTYGELDTYAVKVMVNEIRKTAHREQKIPAFRKIDSVEESQVQDGMAERDYIERWCEAARSLERVYKTRAAWTYGDVLDHLLDGKSMADIGRFYGLSRERVRQIVKEIHTRAKELCDA